MSCYHPIVGIRTATGVSFESHRRLDGHSIELPCGRCIGCRMRRASDWSLRVMHESRLWPENCFVTLTYAPGCLPPNSSLEHSDFQKFMKRVRFHVKRPVRFYMCGEYGDEKGRPHYHACLFNVDFRDRRPAGKSASGELFFESKVLSQLWGHGNAAVQDLTAGTASYCARYIMKKTLGDDAEYAYSVLDPNTGELIYRKPPYAAMSLKPGVGAGWLAKYGDSDVFAHDRCVQDGVERRVPKYYDRLLKRKDQEKLELTQYEREKLAKKSAVDNTDDRRLVREEVHLAKVKTLVRGL